MFPSTIPTAQRGGTWVVDKVVGSEDLGSANDTLKEQLKRVQITREVLIEYIHILSHSVSHCVSCISLLT